jgi:hypothetical protein
MNQLITGKCMSVVESLFEELEITVIELMNGEDAKEKNVKIYDDQIVDLLKRTKELEKQKHVLSETILIVMGIAIHAVYIQLVVQL